MLELTLFSMELDFGIWFDSLHHKRDKTSSMRSSQLSIDQRCIYSSKKGKTHLYFGKMCFYLIPGYIAGRFTVIQADIQRWLSLAEHYISKGLMTWHYFMPLELAEFQISLDSLYTTSLPSSVSWRRHMSKVQIRRYTLIGDLAIN